MEVSSDREVAKVDQYTDMMVTHQQQKKHL